MKKAEKILGKKGFIRDVLLEKATEAQTDRIWDAAARHLDAILAQYADLPKGVRLHTDNYIFPSAAIYTAAAAEIGQASAYAVIEESAVRSTVRTGNKLARLMKVPGMRSFFVWVWEPVARKMFGPDAGFQNVFYPKVRGAYRMDIIACPYCRYFGELGCPELTKIFCENDDRTYGNLPGLQFQRTGTLGKGAEKCDFCIRKV